MGTPSATATSATTRPTPTTAHPAALNALLAFGVCLVWWLRYGAMGPYYDADGALAGAMALRPWGGEFIYQWGGTHIGSIVPLLTVPLVHLGLDVHTASQLALYLVSGTGIGLLLGQFRRWPFAVCFAALLAFPSAGIADTLCQTWCHIPGALLFFGAELWCLRRAAAAPSPANVAGTVLCAGLTVWAADNAVVFFAAQVPLALAALWRQRRAPKLLALLGAGAGGAALVGALIVAGKHFGQAKARYYDLNDLQGVLTGWRCMVKAGGGTLVPSVDFDLLRWALIALFAVACALLLRALVRPLREVSAFALVGTAPLLGLVGTCLSKWFTESCSPRYIALHLVIGELALCLFADELQLALERWLPFPKRPLAGAFALVAAVLAGRSAWVDCGHNHDFVDWPNAIGGGNGELGPERGLHWREKVAAAERQGCQSVIAGYWESYPYFELSNGRLLASDREGDFIQVREPQLGLDAVRRQVVCVVPWWSRRSCPPTLTEFGVTLVEPELVEDQANGRPIFYCRYRGSPPGAAVNGG